MPRTIWKGSISFGLVNIPVRVVGAIAAKEIHFNLLHEKDGSRIRFKRMCEAEGKEVANEDIVKGYELSEGQYVTFTEEELDAVDPEASRTIDIMDFVPLADIDPAYYDKPYFLIPDKNAEKPYALFLHAIKKSKRVGIARVVMREKEYLVALRAKDDLLLMETMHHEEEMVDPAPIAAETKVGHQKVDERQVALAQDLIKSLSSDFEPSRYKDEHRARILAMVEAKAKGHEVVAPPSGKPTMRTVDLMSALERSLEEVRGRPHASKRPSRAKAKAEQSKSARAAKEHIVAEKAVPRRKGAHGKTKKATTRSKAA